MFIYIYIYTKTVRYVTFGKHARTRYKMFVSKLFGEGGGNENREPDTGRVLLEISLTQY